MADSYVSFLRAPTASALAPHASLHYVTTTTTITEAAAIIKHLQAQEKVVKKKSESILSSFGGPDGAVFETETSYEFVRGGGTILPQMDDNMLADSLATVHVVRFDGQGKISQIRLYWDQSTMLKQVDAIGKSGRNWPIRDGIAQIRTIKQSVNATSSGPASAPARSVKEKTDDVVITDRNTHSRSAKNDGDFHARLFATGEGLELRSHDSNPNHFVATRESAKPAPREWDELFTTEGSKGAADPEGRPRTGAGKNFGDNRLFDENTAPAREASPERKKINDRKYGHFEFGHGEGAPSPDPNRPLSSQAKKHTSQWDFEDFVTPEKIKSKPSREHERHIGPGLDEDQPSPEKRPVVHAARPDAKAHFNISDESSPEGGNKATPDSHPVVHTSRPENDVHFSLADSPSLKENTAPPGKARGGLETTYQMGDTIKPMKIYKTAGNGLGSRKGAPSLWDDPEPVKESAIYKTYGNGMGGRRDGGLSWSIGDADGVNVDKEPAIYKTRGDGMGGRRDMAGSRDMGNSARAGATDEYEYEF